MRFFDGAFGTYYYTKTGDANPCELANISNKQVVLDIHREYIAAGANAIKTNTYLANPSVYNNAELKEIITAGYNLAMSAADKTNTAVFADIGNIDADGNLEDYYVQVADIFIELGAVNFIFETLDEFNAIKTAVKNIKEKVKNAVVLVSFAISQDGYSRKGIHYKTLAEDAAQHSDIDIVGLNCICGPAHLCDLANELCKITKPVSIMPNAGYPARINGRMTFRDNAEYFAQKLVWLHELGITTLGGCCGTTPKHIELAVKAVSAKSNFIENKGAARQTSHERSADNKTRLPAKRILVELGPPIDGDCGFILSAVDKLKACGVSTITLTDSPLAKSRADSILTAAKIRLEKNIDVLPHLSCRDKNQIAIKGSLIGASFFGIDKILAITGDPINNSDKKAGVFDFNSQKLISYICSLNREIFSTPFKVGGAINVNAVNFDAELKRSLAKVENGAKFLLSQPIFTKTAADNFNKAKERLDCQLYAGILPVASYRNALFLNNEVAGITISEHMLSALLDKSIEEVYNISINFCKEIIESVYDYADGFYIMTPLKKVDLVCQLINTCFELEIV